LKDVVKDLAAGEAARQQIIFSRGQSLLVAQAFLGALLAAAGVAAAHLDLWHGGLRYGIFVVRGYLVLPTIFMTLSALRSLSALGYPVISSSEIISSARGETSSDRVQNRMVFLNLSNYRQASVVNSWRAEQLINGQKGLRNTTVAFAIVVAATLVAA